MFKCLAVCLVTAVLISGCSGAEKTRGDAPDAGRPHRPMGQACDASGDCPSSLECRTDPETRIADGQCTARCVNTTECQARDSRTLCIAAGICVSGCIEDDECPARTRCNKEGWCERPSTAEPHGTCVGTATPCALLSETQCLASNACLTSGNCTGTAAACESLTKIQGCIAQPGCNWSDDACSGKEEPCSTTSPKYDCLDRGGCNWSPTFSGTPPPCEQISPGLCELTPGCAPIPPPPTRW
jgi:hypothetical protein